MATIRAKSYHYRTRLVWKGERQGVLSASGNHDIATGAPPEFRGHPNVWSPEQLLVGSVESCIMLTFLALAASARVNLVAYESSAEGDLEFLEGVFVVTRVRLSPLVTVASEEDAAKARDIFTRVHEHCFISNSIESEVTVQPHITVRG